MKKLLPGLILISFAFCSCNSKTDKEKKEATKYEEAKESLEDMEKKNPKKYLVVEGHDRRNLVGKTVITGTISNKATVAKFKDIDIELSFYSKTGALLERDHEVIYETIEPGDNTDFKTKYRAPRGTDSVGLKIYAVKVSE